MALPGYPLEIDTTPQHIGKQDNALLHIGPFKSLAVEGEGGDYVQVDVFITKEDSDGGASNRKRFSLMANDAIEIPFYSFKFLTSSDYNTKIIARYAANTVKRPPLLNLYGMNFDGINQYIKVPNHASLHHGGGPFSVAAWIKKDVGILGPIVFKGVIGSRDIWMAIKADNTLECGFEDSGGANIVTTGVTALDKAQWYHVGFSYNGLNTFIQYIDGVQDATLTDGTNPDINMDDLVIGRDATDGTNYFAGIIDEVAIWDAALDASSFVTLYNKGTPIDLNVNNGGYEYSSYLVSWWRLGDKDVYPTVSDRANPVGIPTNNHGAMENMSSDNFVEGAPVIIRSQDVDTTLSSNYALDFNGANEEFINLGDADEFSFTDDETDGPFSISGWIRIPDIVGADPVLSKFYDTDVFEGEWLFTVNLGKVIFQTLDGDGNIRCRQAADTALSINEWHHIVGTYNGNGNDAAIVLYVDGAVAASTGGDSFGSYVCMENTDAEVIIGATLREDPNKAFATAKIDEVSLFARALSLEEVIELKGTGSKVGDAREINNLVGYWRLEEGTGVTVEDLSTNGNDGTLTNVAADGTPTWTLDVAGSFTSEYALDFDAAGSEHINISDDDVFTFNTAGVEQPFSISGWVKIPDTDDYDTILSKYEDTDPFTAEWHLTIREGKLEFQTIEGTSLYPNPIRLNRIASAALSINEWHHVVGTYDASGTDGGMILYVDGEVAASTTNSYGAYVKMKNTSSIVNIGVMQRDATIPKYTTAKIDEVAIFDKVLSLAEIQQLKGSGSALGDARDISNLIGYWRFQEGTGTTVKDVSSQGNDGTLVNTPTWTLDGAMNFANEKSLIFDGVEEYVNVPGPAIDITDPFTLSAWIKLDTIPSGDPYSVMSNADEWTEGGYRLTINTNGSIKVDHYNVALVKAFYALTDDTGLFVVDTWYHISVTKSGATVKIYKDGESLAVTDSSPYTGTASQYTDLQIGAQLNDGTPRYFFDGSIDEVSIWGHSLSESEIEELYNTGVPLNLKLHSQVGNLISWWRMGEGDVPNIITDNHGSSATDGTMIEMDASNIVDDTP